MIVLDRHKQAAIDIARAQTTVFLENWKSKLMTDLNPDAYNYGFVKMYIDVVDLELQRRIIPHNK